MKAVSGGFPIVGIGASAGLGCVIATHFNPKCASFLHQLVARYTSLAVQLAADGLCAERTASMCCPRMRSSASGTSAR